MFDLDTAIATWLHALRHQHTFAQDDLEELEMHLRDHVAAQVAAGTSEEAAFRAAAARLGAHHQVTDEYGKVYWQKIRHQHRFREAVRGRLAMWRSYGRLALRSMRRHWGYAALNVTGLALGMTCFLLIALYVWDEFQYDRFHTYGDRIVRVEADWGDAPFATSSMRTGPTLAADYPEIVHSVRLYPTSFLLATDAQRFQEDAVFYADSAFFDVFDFPLALGDAATALTEPNTIVLSGALAQKYFGDADPIGKTLLADNVHAFRVTGVLAEMPRQSHLAFDALVSMGTGELLLPPGLWEQWFWTEAYTYLRLAEPTNFATLTAKLPDFQARHTAEEAEATSTSNALYFKPLHDLYLNADAELPIGPTSDQNRVLLFALIGLLILCIACINFTNMATAQAGTRAKEVGIRKTVGAGRGELQRQFLAEALTIAVVALGVAGLLVATVLPAFATLTGKIFARILVLQPGMLALMLGLALGTGLLAGGYPAVVLARFQPSTVLKGALRHSPRGRWLRQGLVVFQFAAAITLIAGTFVIHAQRTYLGERSLGFEREQMLVLDFDGDPAVQQASERIKAALLAHPDVQAVTFSSDTPGQNQYSSRTVFEDPDGATQVGFSKLYFVDPDFTETYNLTLIAGRDLSADHAADTLSSVLVNERVVRALGFASPEEILGRRFRQWGLDGYVVGVVANFNFKSLHERIRPLSLRLAPSYTEYVSLRLASNDLVRTVSDLEAIWSEVAPHRPFLFSFLDTRLDQLYQSEARFARVFNLFALLAIGIACLGLFALASFTAAQRTKEIGIRKVLGASTREIILLLSRDFTRLVGVAFLIALPIAYFGSQTWLEGFAYRIDMPWILLGAAGLMALGIAWLTIARHAISAARMNPVERLRYE